jgi:hypothetical protein
MLNVEHTEAEIVSKCRVEAQGVKYLLGAPTTIWVLVGASPTVPTLNVQPHIEDFKAVSTGEKLRAPLEPG